MSLTAGLSGARATMAPSPHRTGAIIKAITFPLRWWVVPVLVSATLIAVEACLALRFWVQLSGGAAPGAIGRLALRASERLASPFQGLDTPVANSTGAGFQLATLIAADFYLCAALVIVLASVAAWAVLAKNDRPPATDATERLATATPAGLRLR